MEVFVKTQNPTNKARSFGGFDRSADPNKTSGEELKKIEELKTGKGDACKARSFTAFDRAKKVHPRSSSGTRFYVDRGR